MKNKPELKCSFEEERDAFVECKWNAAKAPQLLIEQREQAVRFPIVIVVYTVRTVLHYSHTFSLNSNRSRISVICIAVNASHNQNELLTSLVANTQVALVLAVLPGVGRARVSSALNESDGDLDAALTRLSEATTKRANKALADSKEALSRQRTASASSSSSKDTQLRLGHLDGRIPNPVLTYPPYEAFLRNKTIPLEVRFMMTYPFDLHNFRFPIVSQSKYV